MLHVKNISFGYDKNLVLKNIDFTVQQGENLAIIGESGSGKSTLLKLIYGEYDLNKGSIFWDNTEILGPKYNLVVGYDFMKHVSQEFDLMPFTSVEENVGKFLSNFFPEEKKERIAELIEVVELDNFKNTKVKLLSGGQKQRVALARAIAKKPEVILLDEPFSHIDNFKKRSLRRNLFKYLKDQNITCIMATHDKADVLGFSDTIVALNDGVILDKDTVENLYNNPKHKLIASFFEEFNVIESHGIVYANQLKLTTHSDIKVSVVASYFKGMYYLVKATYKNNFIFFHCEKSLAVSETVCLVIDK